MIQDLLKNIILPLLLLVSVMTYGQDQEQKEKVKAGYGVSVMQIQPEFPGGQDSMRIYLKRNIRYPQKALENKIFGTVYIGFIVDPNGKITDVNVLSSLSDELDQEAMRVIKAMPDWKPGTAGGTPINMQFILPVDFYLPGQTK